MRSADNGPASGHSARGEQGHRAQIKGRMLKGDISKDAWGGILTINSVRIALKGILLAE